MSPLDKYISQTVTADPIKAADAAMVIKTIAAVERSDEPLAAKIRQLTKIFFKLDSGPLDRANVTRIMLAIESLATQELVK